MIEQLPIYEVRARNTSADSENKIHDDAVAARFGFSGGLVPGVTVFGYLTVPIVQRFPEWLDRGRARVRFLQPFYDGERVVVKAEATLDANRVSIEVAAETKDGTICAQASASIDSEHQSARPNLVHYESRPMPPTDARLAASPDALIPAIVLGTLVERLNFGAHQQGLLRQMGEELPIYYGEKAVAHPTVLLGLSNHFLMQNVALGPWIHTSSELTNFSAARDGEEIIVRGFISGAFQRKGHEFVELDLLLTAGDRPVQHVRHTAIYKIRQV